MGRSAALWGAQRFYGALSVLVGAQWSCGLPGVLWERSPVLWSIGGAGTYHFFMIICLTTVIGVKSVILPLFCKIFDVGTENGVKSGILPLFWEIFDVPENSGKSVVLPLFCKNFDVGIENSGRSGILPFFGKFLIYQKKTAEQLVKVVFYHFCCKSLNCQKTVVKVVKFQKVLAPSAPK